MPILPTAEQRRANRRMPVSKIAKLGIVAAVAIYVTGFFGGDGKGDLGGGIGTGIALFIVLSVMSISLRSRDRRRK